MRPVVARLILYSRHRGPENMAIDEYLIYFYEKTKIPVLRIYGWTTPSITLGRYQAPDCLDLEACRNDGVEVIRRITGGGAILHHDEVTYSMVCSESDLGGRLSVKESYEMLNNYIINLYRGFGLDARYSYELRGKECPAEGASLCFSGREEYDILVGGKKIGGNAQRRLKGVIFQHGSIPLALNREKLKRYFRGPLAGEGFTSLDEALGTTTDFEIVAEQLAVSFEKTFGLRLNINGIAPDENGMINSLQNSKYLDDRWNLEAKSNEQGRAASSTAPQEDRLSFNA